MRPDASFARCLRVRLTSADISGITGKANAVGVAFYEFKILNELTLEAVVPQKHWKQLQCLAEQRGDQLELLASYGWSNRFLQLIRRRLFMICFLVYIFMCVFLPTRTLFVLVEGNERVSSKRILASAEALGVSFGASRREMRSEGIKNGLLASIPELQWAGVNTYGCVAVITVRESAYALDTPNGKPICNIIANQDAIVRDIVAYRGAVVCKVGQAVKAGDLLVSGYMDCGTHLLPTVAKAEIYGDTHRQMKAVLADSDLQRGRVLRKTKKYSVIIGKNLIKFYKGSGISDTGCVKMYKEYYWKLPGGFTLPFGIAVEENVYYESHLREPEETSGQDLLINGTIRYLLDTMVSGRILASDTDIQHVEDTLILYGDYYCNEMIGQICDEEIMLEYERYGENT